MARFIVSAILVASSLTSFSQDLFKISLSDFELNTDSMSFKISEIVDARKDSKVIGIIQRGVTNRKDLAVFEKPGVQELDELLKRANLFSKDKGIVLRISELTVSEITSMWRETARGEISMDFFIPYNQDYYYVTSVHATIETRGSDVTAFHASNVATVIENALIQFSKRATEVNSVQPFAKEDLIDPAQSFRSLSSMPIVKATDYKEGYYTTFDEFINNAPSVSINCSVKLDDFSLINCDGEEKETSVYGFAKDNQLFIAFHQDFYPIQKINNEFIFFGPRERSGKDIEDAYKGMIVPRQIGKRGNNPMYKIDLKTGVIKNGNGFLN
ncbi:hypothetical protein [Chryseolinea sp. H1M3-3]|uniref:hypothetical protein n=1 Tax=Chryseolinea sp. H1M3-3 TaxID=3034144 RepID=UPI0023EDC088|nr:hypothetical protein [Chryseolinea sp. H1M3-3]